MRIFFVGMPGSGKSMIAREFAKQNSVKFIDADEYIEAKHKQKISDIFKIYGEIKFREFEKVALEEIVKKDNIIIATGGGLPCFYDNLQLMKKAGEIIYLKASENTLFNRITKGENVRPLIQNKSDDEVRLYLNKTLIERNKFYNQADFIIDADKSVSEILDIISSLIKHP